jgi:hypothetical protein
MRKIVWVLLPFTITQALAQSKNTTFIRLHFIILKIFYKNDPDTFDEEWTPKGLQRWTYDKYQNLLTARVLAEIGSAENPDAPTWGCEIENRGVLEDLVKQPNLLKNTD